MFALVDCDQFFVSCERVFFVPTYGRKPVAVLSNNDGCIIARSPEIKALGIKMGEPWFQCQHLLRQHQAAVFHRISVCTDLSQRVIKCIKTFIESKLTPRVEVYSIDEAFIDLKGIALKDLYPLAQELRLQIWQHTGTRISIGIGSSKTLAKVATHFAKRSTERVKVISTEHERLNALHRLNW